ncbi:hypothetical protein BKA70DRAFT_1100998, partial [Coprinopsis sp. MPI-PUGE-AT-0042]
MGITGEVQLTTHFDEEDGSIKVKKTHGRMNYFNGLLTFLLKCNSDVKFIASGGDVTSLMYYVTDYITKAPMTMHAGLAALSYSIRRAEERMDALISTTGASEGAVRKATILPAMTTAVNSMMGRQEISQQQIMNYIVGGGDCYTNERFQMFNWGEIQRYVKRALPSEESSSESTLEKSEETMSLRLNADGTITASNGRLDYVHRPKDERYGSLCLYDFIALVNKDVLKKPSKDNRTDPSGFETLDPDVAYGDRFSSEEHPQYHTHRLLFRRKPVVPVLLGPNLIHKGHTANQEWARDMVILFRPWRTISDLREPGLTWIESFESLQPHLTLRHISIIDNILNLMRSREDRARNGRGSRHREIPTFISADALGDVLDESIEFTNPIDTCIYGTAASLGESVTDSTALRLSELVGNRVTHDFDMCYPVDALMNCDPRDPSTVSGPEDASTVQKQIDAFQSYKTRFIGREKPLESWINQQARNHAHVLPTPSQSNAFISTLFLSQVPQRIRSVLHRSNADMRWQEVVSLIYERNLLGNLEQLRAFVIIAHRMIQGGEQLLMYINGMGGMGKSYLIETLVMLFERLGRRN